MWLCRFLTLGTANEKMFYRDSLMAENITWMKKELYSSDNLIIWAASSHIAKNNSDKKPRWMGEWLSSIYGHQYFAISIQKGRGQEPFLWEKASCKFFSDPKEKFNLVIYLDRLKKIRPEEWKTPCD
jgi:hypothetical protein